jgi:hypothetical protein
METPYRAAQPTLNCISVPNKKHLMSLNVSDRAVSTKWRDWIHQTPDWDQLYPMDQLTGLYFHLMTEAQPGSKTLSAFSLLLQRKNVQEYAWDTSQVSKSYIVVINFVILNTQTTKIFMKLTSTTTQSFKCPAQKNRQAKAFGTMEVNITVNTKTSSYLREQV